MLLASISTHSGRSIHGEFQCKSFLHPRKLKVFDCDTIYIGDRMCKGLCTSYTLPKVVEVNFEKNNDDKIYQRVDKPLSFNGVSYMPSVCPMCLPKEFEEKEYTLACKELNERNISDFNSLLRGKYRYYNKIVKVKLVKTCMCQNQPCNRIEQENQYQR